MDYVMYFDIAALIIIITIMIHFWIKKNISTKQTQVFTYLLLLGFFSPLMNLLSVYLFDWLSTLPIFFNYDINIIYLISFNMLTPAYLYYVCLVIKNRSRFSLLWKIMLYLPALVDLLLIVTTGITKWIFYFDSNNIYRQGILMPVLYIIACYYLILCITFVIRYHTTFSLVQRIAVYFFTDSMIIAVILQMTILKNIMISEFFASISILMIYLSLEDPDDYLDSHLGTYNRNAFIKLVSSYIESNKEFHVLGIQISGFKYINDTIGVNNGNRLLGQVIDVLKAASGKNMLFHISGIKFAILSESQDKNWNKQISFINKRFESPFILKDLDISLSALICSMSYPESVNNLENILDTLECSLLEFKKSDDNGLVTVSDDILNAKRREHTLLRIMNHALHNGEFEVYYQPIYSVKENCFRCAEALLRLNNNELGYVSPEEFIPLAEKNGLILDIGELVFRDVCQFMSKEKISEKGIDYIEINLSVVQCMQEKMYETLLDIIQEYGLPYSSINLEITETSAVISSETLKNNMRYLNEKGVTFALDDYGTGYSNTSNIISYQFNIIKLDKSMVWSAFQQDKALIALKYSIEMIKHMNMKIVAEGVETAHQAQVLSSLGCDYFQGFYYSKPVPAEQFLNMITNSNQ